MTCIREIRIENFRSIKSLVWHPRPGINCLIGPGDGGKSTILDAIDFVLGARRQIPITDADFHLLDYKKPIQIDVTLGGLAERLKDLDGYGVFLRGWKADTHTIKQEPDKGLETVLTVRLTVADDLNPQWLLYSERAEATGQTRDLAWTDRLALAPTRLGPFASQHLSWGPRSILNKLSEDKADTRGALADAARHARESFGTDAQKQLGNTIDAVKALATEYGISLGKNDAQALLDIHGVSLGAGSIALHDGRGVPLRNLGLGSSRLLVAAMQKKAAAVAEIALIDEIEHGLEPFRICRLLGTLGAKDKSKAAQVFMTTHSPVVVRELAASQLGILRIASNGAHVVRHPKDDEIDQPTLRACAEAYLSRSVLVCEGKTEIGFIRGLEGHFACTGKGSMSSRGCYAADGQGENTFRRTMSFATNGYRVAVFRDDDKKPKADELKAAIDAKVVIYQWAEDQAIEDAIFEAIPNELIPKVFEVVDEWLGSNTVVNDHITSASGGKFGRKECETAFADEMRPVLAQAAKNKSNRWLKDIEPMEKVARELVGPELARFKDGFRQKVEALMAWTLAE